MEPSEIMQALQKPFAADEVEWRVQSSGKAGDRIWASVLCYVTNRAIMARLDDVMGIDGWRNHYEPAPTGGGGVICGLSLRINGEWITKYDGAENTDIEAVKGGLSDAMKRAAVQWGIGRYLYKLDATYAVISDKGAHRAQLKDKTPFRWNAPALPAWALPQANETPPQEPKRDSDNDIKTAVAGIVCGQNSADIYARWRHFCGPLTAQQRAAVAESLPEDVRAQIKAERERAAAEKRAAEQGQPA